MTEQETRFTVTHGAAPRADRALVAAATARETESHAVRAQFEGEAPTLTDIKRLFSPGTRWAVTNHYITREDHPCFGTVERAVTRTTSGRVYMARDGERETEINWPKATQVTVADGSVTFHNHPRQPGEPFLTLVQVQR